MNQLQKAILSLKRLWGRSLVLLMIISTCFSIILAAFIMNRGFLNPVFFLKFFIVSKFIYIPLTPIFHSIH